MLIYINSENYKGDSYLWKILTLKGIYLFKSMENPANAYNKVWSLVRNDSKAGDVFSLWIMVGI